MPDFCGAADAGGEAVLGEEEAGGAGGGVWATSGSKKRNNTLIRQLIDWYPQCMKGTFGCRPVPIVRGRRHLLKCIFRG